MAKYDKKWEKEVLKIADGVRMRVFQFTVEQNGGYLSQACSSAETFGALYHGLMKLPKIDKPLLPDP